MVINTLATGSWVKKVSAALLLNPKTARKELVVRSTKEVMVPTSSKMETSILANG